MREERMVCKCTQCKYSHVLMTIQGLYDHMMFLGSVFYVFFNSFNDCIFTSN